jgi:hypothetical protein
MRQVFMTTANSSHYSCDKDTSAPIDRRSNACDPLN